MPPKLNKLSRVLALKEFPYVLTILIAVLGWTFIRISNEITESPTIEYKFISESKKQNDTIFFYYRLINLTKNKQFKDVILRVAFDTADYETATITRGWLIAIEPAPRYFYMPFINDAKTEIEFRIPNFNPQTIYKLRVQMVGHVRKTYIYLANPSVNEKTEDQTLILRKSSVYTFLAKNELLILSILCVFLFTLIIIYLFNVKMV